MFRVQSLVFWLSYGLGAVLKVQSFFFDAQGLQHLQLDLKRLDSNFQSVCFVGL